MHSLADAVKTNAKKPPSTALNFKLDVFNFAI